MSLPPQDPAFDPTWYLQAYPDVAQAGIDPWEHYVRHGKAEGRQPSLNRSEVCDYHLWRGLHGIMEVKLSRLLEEGNELEADYARWALGRWYLWRDELERVADVLAVLQTRSLKAPVHAGPALVLLEALLKLGRIAEANRVLQVLEAHLPNSADTVLARCNLQSKAPPDEPLSACMSVLNGWFAEQGLLRLEFSQEAGRRAFDRLRAPKDTAASLAREDCALISVVVPVFNAGPGLETALRSLHQQTWPNLEVLVVDDASTDSSAALAEELCARFAGPGRDFRLLRQPANAGAYVARNRGMAEASGQFLTVQDADDWSHPQKLERQALALMENNALKASVSHWVRADDDLLFGRWRVEEGWVYRNVSSLMVRRSVVKQLGFWEEVRVNADTEYYYRIMAAWGRLSIQEILPGVPLAFGRAADGSLSQAGPTHLMTQFGGLRKNYMDAAHRWHANAADRSDLYLARGQKRQPSLQDWFQQSGWFDAAWYARRYPDLQEVAIDAFEHWWSSGVAEGRDPGPGFSVSGYCWQQALTEITAQDVAALLRQAGNVGAESPPVLAGECGDWLGRPWVMVCGHQAGVTLFGAERSLLDVLSAFQALELNVLAVLPEAHNREYTNAVKGACQQIGILPMTWWQQGAQPSQLTQTLLEDWLRQFDVTRVYLNTLVHYEPALAARACGIPVTVHARELPARDPSLCKVLNATPEQVKAHVLACADVMVANSRYLADFYQAPKTLVVPNAVNPDDFHVDFPPGDQFRVGLISSNLPKKGLDDFVALAGELRVRGVEATCVLIGPENSHVARLRKAREGGSLPENLEFAGYAESPQQALAQVHGVVNLSHFEESFGRTVLEAMAAGRPVVCYAHGALPELVQDGENGFLAPLGDVSAVADALGRLAGDASLQARMGHLARRRAAEEFSSEVAVGRLQQWLDL